MATPIRFSKANVRRAIYQAKNPVVRPFALNNQPYVRPRITGQVVGDEPIPAQRPSFGGPGGVIPPPGAPPATTPPVPGAGGTPDPGAGYTPPPVPGRGSGYLSWNPQLIPLLPDSALGGYTDATYESDKNTALTNFYDKYHTTLRALGYMDEAGNYQMGDLTGTYQTDQANKQTELSDEERATTEASRDAGILFSGVRARDQSLAQRQTIQDLGDLDLGYQRDTSRGYEDIFGVGGEYASLIQALRQAYIGAATRKSDALTA